MELFDVHPDPMEVVDLADAEKRTPAGSRSSPKPWSGTAGFGYGRVRTPPSMSALQGLRCPGAGISPGAWWYQVRDTFTFLRGCTYPILRADTTRLREVLRDAETRKAIQGGVK
jgi:hypothetical protein